MSNDLRRAEEAVVEAISLRLDSDPHQWSKRPCSTCADITKVIGRDFGCVAYAKSPLTYSDYGKAAASRLSALRASQAGEPSTLPPEPQDCGQPDCDPCAKDRYERCVHRAPTAEPR